MVGEDRQRDDLPQLTVVVASLATLLALMGTELLLFNPGRLSEDGADLVTVCGFGGLAASGATCAVHLCG